MVDIKAKSGIQVAQTPGVKIPTVTLDFGRIPEISLGDLQACLKRSGAARSAHADIQRHVDGGTKISRKDLEGMLARAGVETTDVKTVLAYHAREHAGAFSDDAITFLTAMDWTDVAAAHVDELKRQNKEQVAGHRSFIDTDRREFQARRKDDGQKLQKVHDEKSRLQQKTPLELEADFAEETTKSGLNSKESFLLLAHRKRFATRD
jgi:hypothetical protein